MWYLAIYTYKMYNMLSLTKFSNVIIFTLKLLYSNKSPRRNPEMAKYTENYPNTKSQRQKHRTKQLQTDNMPFDKMESSLTNHC